MGVLSKKDRETIFKRRLPVPVEVLRLYIFPQSINHRCDVHSNPAPYLILLSLPIRLPKSATPPMSQQSYAHSPPLHFYSPQP